MTYLRYDQLTPMQQAQVAGMFCAGVPNDFLYELGTTGGVLCRKPLAAFLHGSSIELDCYLSGEFKEQLCFYELTSYSDWANDPQGINDDDTAKSALANELERHHRHYDLIKYKVTVKETGRVVTAGESCIPLASDKV